MATYRVHIFTSSNNFVVNSIAENVSNTVEYLIVAGGGGGGGSIYASTRGGGGGAGGVKTGYVSISATTYTVNVGSGGAGGVGADSVIAIAGGNSSVFGISTLGGGYGATYNRAGTPGGSGGGAGTGSYATGYSGTPGQGNPGGNSVGYTDNINTGGGGGGGGGGSGSASSSGNGGSGGAGIPSSITGIIAFYAGGGGGGGGTAGGLGGTGGGGSGATGSANGSNGTPGTGGGGGGSSSLTSNPDTRTGGNGGSGIVIIKYPITLRETLVSRVKSIIPSSNTIYESEQVVVTVNMANAANGTVLYYTTSGNAEVYAPNIEGQFTVNGNTGSFSVIAESSVPSDENRIVNVQIRRNSNIGPILGITSFYVINVPADPSTINYTDYLAVAAGGGGGRAGGGAGGLLTGSLILSPTNIGLANVTIGAGGLGSSQAPWGTTIGTRGGNTSVSISGSPILAVGGGSGRHDSAGGSTGGSGGGHVNPASLIGFANVAGQGYPGGGGAYGGGGGGAGQAGQDGPGNGVGGNGGNGLPIAWMTGWYGESNPFATVPGRWFAGGGGTRGNPTYIAGKGGWGGGGPGGRAEGSGASGPGGAGNVNTGGGGGGSEAGFAPGMSGGSGIFVLRYPTASRLLISGGNVIIENNSKYHVFSNSGNLNISYVDSFNPKISIVSNVLASSNSIFLGGTVTFTVDTLNASNGEVLYYTTSGLTTGNTGSFLLFGNSNSSISITPIESGNVRLQVRRRESGAILAQSGNVTILPPPVYLQATGGNITISGGYRIHTFTTSNNLVISSLGSPSIYNTVDYLVVAGGGGGGWGRSTPTPASAGGGGGGGGVLTSNLVAEIGTYIISVGAGGAASPSGGSVRGGQGGESNIILSSNTLVSASGGGGGGGYPALAPSANFWRSGAPGGSGGGGSTGGGGSAISGQGFPGGPGDNIYPNGGYGGGGGGAGGSGIGSPGSAGLDSLGGIGLTSNITGINVVYAGGGAGCISGTVVPNSPNGSPPSAPLGGGPGGGGGGISQARMSGNVNTGGGGAGTTRPASPLLNGSGGSGIVIIRYPFA